MHMVYIYSAYIQNMKHVIIVVRKFIDCLIFYFMVKPIKLLAYGNININLFVLLKTIKHENYLRIKFANKCYRD